VLAAILLLAAAILPALAGNRVRSDRVLCANNLRQIGMALQLWGNEHGDQQPWEVLPSDGGTFMHPLAPNVWYHFAWMSNELVTPKILFCPTDTGQAARDFTGDPNGGYLHPNFANRATSYFLSHPRDFGPGEMLAGDRNVTADSATSCSRFSTTLQALPQTFAGLTWTSALHNNAGNILALDGRVEQYTTPQLQRGVTSYTGGSPIHYITPR
jgi:prepilin-type processing-associated H-X9-DG protein